MINRPVSFKCFQVSLLCLAIPCGFAQAQQCTIGGVVYSAGTVNPANACQVCTPSISTTNWSTEPNGTTCNDGNACTQTDICQAGVCIGSNPVFCTPLDQCHLTGTCNPSTGLCSNPSAPNGTACNDGNACTQPDVCLSGLCTGSNPVTCTPLDECHLAGTCNPNTGLCSNPTVPNGGDCELIFVNGGFQTGAGGTAPPSPWAIATNLNPGFTAQTPQTLSSLNLTAGGNPLTIIEAASGGPFSQPDPDLGSGASLRWPRYGTQAAIVNLHSSAAFGNSQNANSLSQTTTIASDDVDPADGMVHIRFTIAPVLQNPSLAYSQMPYYFLQLTDVTQGTVLYEDFGVPGQGSQVWQSVNTGLPTEIDYTDWQLVSYTGNSPALNVGDQVQLLILASGSVPGASFGEIWVDGIGSTIPGISVEGSVAARANPGSQLTYTFNYQNEGGSTATNVVLNFTTPPNTTFQSLVAPFGFVCTTPTVGTAGTVNCNAGTLTSGATGSYSVTVGVSSTYSGTVTLRNYSIASDQETTLLGPPVVTPGVATANVCPVGQTTPAPCSDTIALQFNVPDGTTLGANPVQVVTQGAPNLDFTLASTTCTGSPSSCAVNVTFAPLAPGVRMGAVNLTDSSGNPVASILIYGIGNGPSITFAPGAQATVGSGLGLTYSVAADGAGDIFIADYSNNQVVKVPAGGGPQTTVGSGLSGPAGVAVDGAGDVFIADQNNQRVVEVTPSGVQTTVPATGLSQPQGIAVDGAGNVFIADRGNSRVVEVPAGGGVQFTVGSGLSQPTGVAVDGAGDVFIADQAKSQVIEIPAGGSQTTVGSGLSAPTGLAVDGAGNVFIADQSNNRVVEVSGGAQVTVGSGLNQPAGVALDATGDVFIADQANHRAIEVQRSQPPTLSFSTAPNTTSTAQSVVIQNIGNQPLNAVAPGLSIGANYAQTAGPGTPPDCTSTFTLAPEATCNLSITFTPPSAGSFPSAATFKDNALNATASQSIVLNGTGVAGGTTTTALASSANPSDSGEPVTFTATITPQYSGSVTGTVAFLDGATNIGSGPVSSNAASLTLSSLKVGAHRITAGYSGDSNFSGSTSPVLTQTVSRTAFTTTTITSATPNPADYHQAIVLNVSVTGGVTPTGGVTFTYGSPAVTLGSATLSGGTASFTIGATKLAVGTYQITANYPGNASHAASASLPTAVTVNLGPTTTSVVSSLNPSAKGQSVTFTATVSAQYGGTLTGTVAFSEGATVLKTVTLRAGKAVYTTTRLAKGSNTITATYSGSAEFAGSSNSVVQRVN